MKLPVLLGIALMGLTSFSIDQIDQANFPIIQSSEHPGELIIGMPDFNSKRYDEVIGLINGIDGVEKINYCESLKVFMIQYDQNKIHSSEDLFAMLEKALHDFHIFHKIGTSITDVKNNCKK